MEEAPETAAAAAEVVAVVTAAAAVRHLVSGSLQIWQPRALLSGTAAKVGGGLDLSLWPV
jgi:hypothetical protein